MTKQELEDMQKRCKAAEEILKQIEELEDRIKIINAELSHFQGDKDLMVRDKWNSLIPKEIFPYCPTDEELTKLGVFIQQIYMEKIDFLRTQLNWL